MKPAFHIPSMAEVRKMPWNGFTVASTFSGCGGSSLGYRMAGFKVLWANEFVAAAQETYRANAAPYTKLNTNDITTVTASMLLREAGLSVGELDLFDGSPPCQSFSTSGKRSKKWDKDKKYSDDKVQKSEFLFEDFARLLKGVQPKTFVAENVVGLSTGQMLTMCHYIIKLLCASGYKVKCKILDAQWLGVPQARRRLIFMGVRNDLAMAPVHPEPLPYFYTVNDALPHVKYVSQLFMGKKRMTWRDAQSRACGTILASGLDRSSAYMVKTAKETRLTTIEEAKTLCSFPKDFVLTGTPKQQWERIGRAVPPVMMSHVAATIRDKILRKL